MYSGVLMGTEGSRLNTLQCVQWGSDGYGGLQTDTWTALANQSVTINIQCETPEVCPLCLPPKLSIATKQKTDGLRTSPWNKLWRRFIHDERCEQQSNVANCIHLNARIRLQPS